MLNNFKKPILIAEIGCNHKGDIKIAKKMLKNFLNGENIIPKDYDKIIFFSDLDMKRFILCLLSYKIGTNPR